MTYTATFTTGQLAPVTERGDSGAFLIGLARRDDGYMRAVFFDRAGQHHADPWISRITPADGYDLADRLAGLRPVPSKVSA